MYVLIFETALTQEALYNDYVYMHSILQLWFDVGSSMAFRA